MDWIGDHLWETWLIAAILLGVVEMVSLDLVLAMFAFGAVVGMITALIGLPGVLQVLIALGATVGALGVLRPGLVHRLHAGPTLRTGSAALIGQSAQVLTALGPGASGRVKIGGEEWTAQVYDEYDEFEPGERAEVVEIRGATAYVRRV